MITETGSRMQHQATHAIERGASGVPSDLFLWAAGASIAASLMLKFSGRDQDALFVGQWAPTFMALGIYSKLSKAHPGGQGGSYGAEDSYESAGAPLYERQY